MSAAPRGALCAIDAYTRACRTSPIVSRQVQPDTGVSLYSWSIKPTRQVRIPSNNEVTLVAHLGGTRRVRVFTEDGVSQQTSRPGDITLIPRHQSIKYLIDGPVTFATLHFPLRASEMFNDSCGEHLIKLPHCFFALPDDYATASVRTLLSSSKLSAENFSRYSAKVLESLAWHLLRIIADGNAEPVRLAQPGAEKNRLLEQRDYAAVLSAIDRHLDGRLRIDDLAEIAGQGRTAFCEQFSQQFGLPPHRFIVERRIERAKQLLQSERTITDIAYELGFSSASHFSTTFKANTGMTPKAFMQQRLDQRH